MILSDIIWLMYQTHFQLKVPFIIQMIVFVWLSSMVHVVYFAAGSHRVWEVNRFPGFLFLSWDWIKNYSAALLEATTKPLLGEAKKLETLKINPNPWKMPCIQKMKEYVLILSIVFLKMSLKFLWKLHKINVIVIVLLHFHSFLNII